MQILPGSEFTHAVSWRSPSNIALVKYWGKYGNQYPQNPSLSFTLSQSCTETKVAVRPRQSQVEKSQPISLNFLFHDHPNPSFAKKISAYLQTLLDDFPFLANHHLEIRSSNSFPHSSGIASSASGMSALALCLCSLDKKMEGALSEADEVMFLQKASYYSRLGSGSACRSVFPQAAVWGNFSVLPASSQDYAIPYGQYLSPVFQNYCDAILIISSSEKSVSSRAGHGLMEQNPYALIRYKSAHQHLIALDQILQSSALDEFADIVELEALELHALMMCSNPSFILMKPGTLAVISEIRRFRQETKIPVCFTLDAGPNVHVLYPPSFKTQTEQFIQSELLKYCDDNYCIWDQAGDGPVQLL
ncbi:MAG: diphosphomevalonate decarboxylase [Sphingobacteriales bacterium]|nr:MAG: diphosphomevalonate decarboxylase [Sphingobacteriales bacterium]